MTCSPARWWLMKCHLHPSANGPAIHPSSSQQFPPCSDETPNSRDSLHPWRWKRDGRMWHRWYFFYTSEILQKINATGWMKKMKIMKLKKGGRRVRGHWCDRRGSSHKDPIILEFRKRRSEWPNHSFNTSIFLRHWIGVCLIFEITPARLVVFNVFNRWFLKKCLFKHAIISKYQQCFQKNVFHGGFEVDLTDFHDLFPEKNIGFEI